MTKGEIHLQFLKDTYATFYGRRHLWDKHKAYQDAIRSAVDAIENLNQLNDYPRFGDLDSGNDSPIFILSAGWRSGSTLVQRLICTRGKRFLWGEPFGDTGLTQFPAELLKKFTPSYPPISFFANAGLTADDLSHQWIANLYPSLDDLRCGLRVFYDTMFRTPVSATGDAGWGFKEIRLTAEDAAILRWLYPSCLLVFLVRNPIDAFRSYAPNRPWYIQRPNKPVITARQFAVHWKRTAESFRVAEEKLGAVLLRFEDITQNHSAIDRLDEYIGYEVDRSILDERIRFAKNDQEKVYEFLPFEKHVLIRGCGKTFSDLGYHH